MKIFVLSIFEWSFYTGSTVLTFFILEVHIYVMQQKGHRGACASVTPDERLCYSVTLVKLATYKITIFFKLPTADEQAGAVGSQKNGLNETVLLSTQNKC